MATLIKNILEKEAVNQLSFDFNCLKILPKETAEKIQLLIFAKKEKNTLEILTTNNKAEEIQRALKQLQNKGYRYELFYTTAEGFSEALKQYDLMDEQSANLLSAEKIAYEAEGKSAIKIIQENFEKREKQEPGDFIMNLIRLGFQSWASDLHFQPEEKGIVLRLRIDGILYNILEFDHQDFWKYMQKIKFITGAKMNVKQLPQDGRFSFEASDRKGSIKKVDARVSFMPGIKNESIVIRFLDASQNMENFEEIWFSSHDIQILEKYLKKTSGIIIITGPTGSGKTTTLYTILKKLNNGKNKIITLEDPIEYKIQGLQQSQINYDQGYDYEIGLKAILRQDPDIILVGETRTKETANISINASLTGHLVFTTLHTNSAIDSLSRILNMGVEPYLLAPALHLIIGQRLVRRVCPHCGKWESVSSAEDKEIQKHLPLLQKKYPEIIKNYQGKLIHPQWCEHCNHTGYIGRVALIELLEISPEIREQMLLDHKDQDIKNIAKKEGFLSLKEEGILKAIQGITSLEEIHRIAE